MFCFRSPHRAQTEHQAETDVVTTTRIVIAATPPDYGISSFGRLLDTATNDPGFTSPGS
ncbi:hypothetical protein GCM10009589_00540 [Arthrobacter pascens]